MSKTIVSFLLLALLALAGASFVGTANAAIDYPELPSVLNPVPLDDGKYMIDGSTIALRHASPTEMWLKAKPGAPVIIFTGSTTNVTEIPRIDFLEKPSDINNDGEINVIDITKFMRSYGKYGTYDIHFDGDLDGRIDVADLAEVLILYG